MSELKPWEDVDLQERLAKALPVTDNKIRIGDAWVNSREEYEERCIELFEKYFTQLFLSTFETYTRVWIEGANKGLAKPGDIANYAREHAEAAVQAHLQYEDKVKGLSVLAEADLGEDR